MNRYSIYCTEEQTLKALDLGAPIELWSEYYKNQEHDFKLDTPIPCKHFPSGYCAASCPTAEQMLAWLEEKEEISVDILYVFGWTFNIWYFTLLHVHSGNVYDTRKEATLAAIDAALKNLSKKNKGE